MNDKVDVLTALDNAIQRAVERGAAKGSPSFRELRQARAAVAELIEVASEFDGYVAADHNDTSIGDREDMWDRLSSALSRVKGE